MGLTRRRHILVVDDTKALADMYASALKSKGYTVSIEHSLTALEAHLSTKDALPDLLILDVRLPDGDGLETLETLKNSGFPSPVIVITGHGSVHMAVEAMRRGAADFLIKPFTLEKLEQSVERALPAPGLSAKSDLVSQEESREDVSLGAGITGITPPAHSRNRPAGFIGLSPPMQLVYDMIENAAKSNATVFITGESGTGKEICAQSLHCYSKRSAAPFVAINCAAIPRELLESELFGHVKGAFTGAVHDRDGAVVKAHGGTLFLDEIAEMAPEMQSKLLRFLQNLRYQRIGDDKERSANVRIICATNRDPVAEMRAGRLRQDLFYRLHVIPIHMPALRHRRGDIIDLADYFMRLYTKEEEKNFHTITPEAEHALMTYSWPGNVRQLQNVIRGIIVMHDHKTITPDLLPREILQASPTLFAETNTPHTTPHAEEDRFIRPLWQVEKDAIERAVAICEGNIPKAAALLGVSPSTLYRKKMSWENEEKEDTRLLG